MPEPTDAILMKEFPDFRSPGFDIESYNERFKNNNVIIHAKSFDVSYPEHWGCFSVKCAFNGNEYYESNNCVYAVNDTNYLIFNEGKTYSSYIFSKKPVESFTINFCSSFQQSIMCSLFNSHDMMLSNAKNHSSQQIQFVERLYKHDRIVSPVLYKLYNLSATSKPNHHLIEETYHVLFEKLLLLQQQVKKEVQQVDV